MAKATQLALISLFCGASLWLTGCGADDGPKLADVTGQVTFDDEPLEGANIEFQPAVGSPSYGRTDKDGQYQLMYTSDKAGATVGKHVVRITTLGSVTGEDGETIEVPERLPAKYHAESELSREVKPGGNSIKFSLTSELKSDSE